MLTEKDFMQLEKQASKLYGDLELEIIQEIAERIANVGYANTVVHNDVIILQEMGVLHQDIIEMVAKYNETSVSQIQEIFETAGVNSLRRDDTIYKLAGLNPQGLNYSMMQLLSATARKTNNNLSNLTMTTASTSQMQFLDAMNKAYMEVSAGVKSYSQSIIDTINIIGNQGIQIQYPSGVKRSLESAVRTNILTSVNQTSGKLQEMRAEEMEWDLVEVSAHGGARPEHAEWQGKVYSLKGITKGYKILSDATGYGTVTGLCGANCRHTFFPYYKGSTKTYTNKELFDLKNEKVEYNGKQISKYDATQIQRKMERQIRQNKKDIAGLQGILASKNSDINIEEIKEKLRSLQSQLRNSNTNLNDLVKQTELKKDYSRLVIGKTVTKTKNDAIINQYNKLNQEEFIELSEKHRKNISNEIRNSIYKTDWDNMQELNKFGYINSNYSGAINYYRRTGQNKYGDKYIKEFDKTILNLQNAIANNKLQKNIEVTRYLDLEWLKDKIDKKTYKEVVENSTLDNLINELKGKSVKDNQFISTSATIHNNMTDRKLKMTIKADKGTHAFITENKMESEIIFDASELLINEIKVENDKLVLEVKLKERK